MPLDSRERDLTDALAELWTRRRDGFAARVATVETAVLELLGGTLDEDTRAEAECEAHKLAGALGTFGVPGGSELARELEHSLAAERIAAETAPRLAELVLALGREVERGPTPRPAAASLKLPEPDGDSARASTSSEEASASPRLLVVTGDSVLAERLTDEGSALGVRVSTVRDIADAAEAISRAQPTAAIVDLGDGNLDPALLRLLQRVAAGEPRVPTFVLHAGEDLESRVGLARSRVSCVLPRSLTPAAVVGSVERTLARRTPAQSRVVALDDDPSILDALVALLGPDGVDVVGVDSPEGLWELLRGVPPDLIILDVDMPTVNGVDMCRVLRADARFEELPVLFLTARTDSDSLRRMFDAGADDYVAKPIVVSELRGRVRNRIARARLLRELADQDGLTGVPNRRRASADLARLGLMAERYGLPLSIAVLDIDHFKAINDVHGHATGDAVLRALGALLLRSFRGEDAIGRWGGEEFMVGLYGGAVADGVRRLEQLLERFSAIELPSPTGAPVRATFSAGIAQLRVHAADLQGLFGAADAALYLAKTHGRARVLAAGWTPPGGVRQVDVLIVEDDEALRDVLLQMLQIRGYTNAVIADGRAAAEALEGADPQLRPRVVLLDVDLPGLDGLSVLRRLGRNGALDRLRVIMLTARAGEAEVVEALELGAFDHVAKPFSVPILIRRIERALASV